MKDLLNAGAELLQVRAVKQLKLNPVGRSESVDYVH